MCRSRPASAAMTSTEILSGLSAEDTIAYDPTTVTIRLL